MTSSAQQDSSVPSLLTPGPSPWGQCWHQHRPVSSAQVNSYRITQLLLALTMPFPAIQPSPGAVLSIPGVCGISGHHPVTRSVLGSPLGWVALRLVGVHQRVAVGHFQAQGRLQRAQLGLLMICYLHCMSGITPASWLGDR